MQYKETEKSKRIAKNGVEYDSFFLDSDFILGSVKFDNFNLAFDIQEKIIRFNDLKFTKGINSEKLETLVEENEIFAKENNCSKIIYEFPPSYIQLCSKGGIENNDKPLKRILMNKSYKFSELLNGFFNQGIKKIE